MVSLLSVSTSGMAEDVIELLDYLGWTRDRELNIVGISLGGMIAQGGCCLDNLLSNSRSDSKIW